MSRAVRGVLFDLDGTLSDRSLGVAAWARWFARDRLGLATDREIDEAVAFLIGLDAGGYGPKDVMFQSLKERHPHLQDEVGALIKAFREHLLVHLPPLDDDTVNLLGAFNRAGLPWGIVTNGSRGQLGKIRALGLASLASCVVVSELFGARKPDAAIFRAAAAQIGVAPPDILFVGDDPAADIVGAARAGMQTAWLRRERGWPPELAHLAPDHTITSLAELSRLLPLRGGAAPGLANVLQEERPRRVEP